RQLVELAQVSQLKAKIGNHPAGHLVQRMKGVVFQRSPDRQILLLRYPGEMIAHRFDGVLVDYGLITESARVHGDVEQRWIGRAVGERRDRSVDRSDAEFDR